MNSAEVAIESNYFIPFETTSVVSDSETNHEIPSFPIGRDMQEIIPGLYLGPYTAATRSKLNHLIEAGITHIVCVRHELEASIVGVNFPDKFKYIVINLADGFTSNIIPFLPQVNNFIDKCIRSGGKVLVHGHFGISRSAALVIAYLMEARSLSYRDALSLVQEKRLCVNINEAFMNQLQEYEPIYKARNSYSKGHTSKLSGNQGKLKRRYDEVLDSESCNKMEICEESNT